MEANAGMVAGSHRRNELILIRRDGEGGPKSLKNMNGQVCQICGDSVGVTAVGEMFVACNECAFPVCRPCYEYERKEGNQSCPQCKTKYKRHTGSPRVDGDDDEDDVDDLDNEFHNTDVNGKAVQQQTLLGEDPSSSSRQEHRRTLPLLTNGQSVSGEIPIATPDCPSIQSPSSGPLGMSEKRTNSLSHIDPSIPVPVRIVDPTKDLNSYGLGNVDWKERVEGWKLKQEKNVMQVPSKYTNTKGDIEGTGSNGEDLQIAAEPKKKRIT